MRVLNVNHTLDPVTGGGTAERTFQMSRFLARSGVDCTVLTTAAGCATQLDIGPDRVKIVTLPLLWKRFFVPQVSWQRLQEIVSAADIVHLMGHWSVLNALVYKVVRRLHKPYVVCPAGALPIYGRSKALKHIYNTLIGVRLVHDASACVAITEDETAHFTKHGADSSKVYVIPNGVDAKDFVHADPAGFRAKFNLDAHPFVLFMGRLNSIKGPDLLLQAFFDAQGTYPDLHLVFAGPDGGMLEKLQQAAHANGVAKRVHFLGYVSREDKASAYGAALLLAIPSRQEAMSIVALEAGISGTPVLLTDQCGFDAVSDHGGCVVTATADGIGKGLAEMLATPATLKERGELLREFVNQQHRWESVVRSYIELFERLTRNRAV